VKSSPQPGPTPAPTRPALRYYGAKWRLARWIISHFPPHTCYVEPFGGTGAVLLKKEPSELEVYNDLDTGVVNFFRVLRTQPRDLIRQLRATPYSRAEFEGAYFTAPDPDTPLENARRFFIKAWMGHGGPRDRHLTGWKIQKRRWISGRADQISEWNTAKALHATARRFLQVQIEQDDALRVIRRFDTPDTLFYLDPPYPSDTRNARWCQRAYNHELPLSAHALLADALQRIQGKAIISTYPNPIYAEAFATWKCVSRTAQTMNKTIATELLYLNF